MDRPDEAFALGVARDVVGQDRNENAGAQLGLDQPSRQQGHAETGAGGAKESFAVVGAKGASKSDLRAPAAAVGDEPAIGLQAEQERRAGGEVVGAGDRMAGEEGRARAKHAPVWGKLAGDEAGVGQRADADGEIGAGADQVDREVGQGDVEADARVGGGEDRQVRHDVQAAERAGQVEAQQALRGGGEVGGERAGVVEVGQDAAGAVQVGGADLGRVQPAGGAVEEGGAEVGFEGRDGARDRGGLDPGFAGGGGEAAEFGGADEGTQAGEFVHSCGPRKGLLSAIALPQR